MGDKGLQVSPSYSKRGGESAQSLHGSGVFRWDGGRPRSRQLSSEPFAGGARVEATWRESYCYVLCVPKVRLCATRCGFALTRHRGV